MTNTHDIARGARVIDAAEFVAAAFDLDGVITRTANLHAMAWRQLFDEFLKSRAAASGEEFAPFDIDRDYRAYVDGRPRSEGVRAFLASRGISLPEGGPGEAERAQTVRALAARKERLFLEHLARAGVEVFQDCLALLKRLRKAGIKTALVSSSRNAGAVLAAAGLTELFDVVVDGIEADRLGLKGKPAPDTYLEAARSLGVAPAAMVGFEDALVGVESMRAAGYGLVVGVDRSGQSADLRRHGAELAVSDLAALEVVDTRATRPGSAPPAPGMSAVAPAAHLTQEPGWLIVEEGFTLTREHELESIFAIGNGHLGSRGSLSEGSPMSSPATFVAGLFDGRPGSTIALAVLPDWNHLSVSVEGRALRLDEGRVLAHRRTLDLKRGTTWREWRHEDRGGRITRLRELRLASRADRRLLVQSVTLEPENFSGAVTVDARLAGPATLRTSGGITAALATAAQAFGVTPAEAPQPIDLPLTLEVELGRTYRLDRIVAVCTSRDDEHPEAAAAAAATAALATGVTALVASHHEAWRERWSASGVEVEGDPAAQRALRFAAYHLLSAVDPSDERASIGARALTGGAYNGHVFWDTEIFMLPFFVLTWPQAARALLMYRHHTLPAARAKAAAHGARGGFYAWESADTGEDVTPRFVLAPDGLLTPIVLADQEQHISADVAYAVWSYWRATGDERFLLEAGAEILLETARFWASRAAPGDDGLRHIRGVVGPDEYHEGVDDDAYTNGMARWNLESGAAIAGLLAERWPERWRDLARRIGLDADEPRQWEQIARELYTGFDPATGLIEQFRGYFGLEDIDLAAFEPRKAPIDVLLGRERIQGSRIIKQPDVVMLLHLLWDRYPPDVRAANFQYYAPRCAHGSSLSPAIHALVAARLGELALAERYFRQAAEIDLADNMGNAALGIHAAALGGLWQAAVFGFAGLRLTEAGPELHPNLPPQWGRLSFRTCLRGRKYQLSAAANVAPGSAKPEIAR